MIKLAICSPILDVDDYAVELAECLARLRAEGLRFEHVVVGPARNASAVAAVFGRVGSSFHAERAGTRGVFDAVAQGYAYALSTWAPTHLSYINADDRLELGFAKAVAACRLGESQLITGEVEWIGEKGQRFGRVPTWPWQRGAACLFEAGVPPFTQQGVILSSTVWKEVGGFNPAFKYIADSALWHRLLRERRVQRIHIKDWVASYRMRNGQLSGNRQAVTAENISWIAEAGPIFASPFWRIVVLIGMRLYFSPRYLGRALSGRRLRSEDAMKAGGFNS